MPPKPLLYCDEPLLSPPRIWRSIRFNHYLAKKIPGHDERAWLWANLLYYRRERDRYPAQGDIYVCVSFRIFVREMFNKLRRRKRENRRHPA